MKGKIIALILCLTALTVIAQDDYVFKYKLRGETNIQNFEKRHIPQLARICNPCLCPTAFLSMILATKLLYKQQVQVFIWKFDVT